MWSVKAKGVVVSLMVHPFFDSDTCSYSYAVVSPKSRTCAIIDAVLNYDLSTGKSTTTSADDLIEFVEANDLTVEWILETHIHADHVSAAAYLKQKFVRAQTAIGAEVVKVQEHFAKLFDVGCDVDGSQFDRLLKDNDRIWLGRTCGRVIHTPGHTAACVTYVFGNVAFVGDTLFVGGCGRLFEGTPQMMEHSLYSVLGALPGDSLLYSAHEYTEANLRFARSVDGENAELLDTVRHPPEVVDVDTDAGKAELLKRSPLTKVHEIIRPLLIGQGANDPRVTQIEADQIVEAMTAKKIPVTYVLYPDEGHGFSGENNRMSFNAVTEAFLAKHLGGAFEPAGDDLEDSSLHVPTGAGDVPGLDEALPEERKQMPKEKEKATL